MRSLSSRTSSKTPKDTGGPLPDDREYYTEEEIRHAQRVLRQVLTKHIRERKNKLIYLRQQRAGLIP